MNLINIEKGAELLRQGNVIAYPTEAVFGFGCCPYNLQALQYLLKLKQRPWQKGLILIASDLTQLLPLIEVSTISSTRFEEIKRHWPGPFTFVFPASNRISPLVKGDNATVAVRVSAHPIVSELCDAFGGAIVSTSANESNLPPFKKAHEIEVYFGNKIAGIVAGEIGDSSQVTPIEDALTGKKIR